MSGVGIEVKEPNKKAHKQTKDQAGKARKVSEEAIRIVFEYWKEKVAPKSRAVLDDKRVIRIGWAIHDYGIETCKQAIDGITKSPWHMGKNPNQRKYNDVELIFRDADNVEKFAELGTTRDSREAAREAFLSNPEW